MEQAGLQGLQESELQGLQDSLVLLAHREGRPEPRGLLAKGQLVLRDCLALTELLVLRDCEELPEARVPLVFKVQLDNRVLLV